MANPLTAKQIRERALAGGLWLVNHQNQDGSWRDLGDPNVGAFYKACWALSEVGQSSAAHRCLDYVRRHFLSAEGDVLPEQSTTGSSLLGQYPYVNSYLIVGGMRAGRYEIAVPAASSLITQQAEDHGGFYSSWTEYGRRNTSDTMSSSSAGIACLAAGQIEAARRVADYLDRIVQLQPSGSDRFFTTTDAAGRLHEDIHDNHGGFLRVIDTQKPEQCWFAVGLPMAFLVLLASATGEARYRELADWYFNFQRRCINPWDGYSSGKGGWGCAMLYRITGEVMYRDIALHVARGITDRQRTDGSWLSGMGSQGELVNADFDLTGEFTLWLSLISANVLARDAGRLPVAVRRRKIPKPKRTQSISETLRRTALAHYRIMKNEGIKGYFMRSYQYRKKQILGRIRNVISWRES
jgi:hypothetical protein